jgi:hypothetical protein
VAVSAPLAARIAGMALQCVERAYPYKMAHVLMRDDDAQPPRRLTPAFYGCFDWHSAVHAHWSLATLCAAHPEARWAEEARRVLRAHLTPANIAAEVAYQGPRPGFECPYGLTWLLLLAVALRRAPALAPEAAALAPLEALAAARLVAWMDALPRPIRSGEHSQSAFGMTLLGEWAEASGRVDVAASVRARAFALHGDDRDVPLHLEPSGYDFLSPALGAAALMAAVWRDDPPAFAGWLARACPALLSAPTPLTPTRSPDPSDGKLAHLDGLNASRAWCLAAVAQALPPDQRPNVFDALRASAQAHLAAALDALDSPHYACTHWLGSFALRALCAPCPWGEILRGQNSMSSSGQPTSL